MEIRITLEGHEPPEGWIHAGEDEDVRFSGWLGLLQALAELSPGPDQPSRRAASADSSTLDETSSLRNTLDR